MKQKIVTIHGIRRKNKWYNTFEDAAKDRGKEITFYHFEYGYFDLIRFIFPPTRNKIIARFQDFYSNNFSEDSPCAPSLICHSFGTFIFYSSIKKYKDIKFDKVILCGAILNPDTDWNKFYSNQQIKKLFNDYGSRDKIVSLSSLALGSEAGNAGEIGFKNEPKVKFLPFFFQNKNEQFGHSDYFLSLHMRKNWMPFLFGDTKKFQYKNNILRQDIIDRMYQINEENKEKYTRVFFSARVDRSGNYYADYQKEGVCEADSKNSFHIYTAADSVVSYDSMNFKAMHKDGRPLTSCAHQDGNQRKIIEVSGINLERNDHFYFRCLFKWLNTINIKQGDTDNFWVKDCGSYKIRLQFASKLSAYRFYALRNKEVVAELTCKEQQQKDGTFLYTTESDNNQLYDGVIFYFEGEASNVRGLPKSVRTEKKKVNTKSDNKSYFISTCIDKDIKNIYKIESQIELGNAAMEQTLYDRLNMFPAGFLVAKNDQGEVVGYLESVVWRDIKVEQFSEISDFPMFHNINGDTLYIIFIAVQEAHRGEHIGLELVRTIIALARKMKLSKVELVAKDPRIGLYQKCGFNYVHELPYFLPSQSTKSIYMRLPLQEELTEIE